MAEHFDKFDICIIDEPLDLEMLSKLFPNLPTINLVNHRENSMVSSVSHGTYCTAILIEALRAHRIVDKVTLTHYSIANENEPMSITELIHALKYCVEVRPQIISLSLGSERRRLFKQIFPILSDMKGSVILAAASNNMKITYPAALPQVIGVKRNTDISMPLYLYLEAPLDGVELLVNMAPTDMMKRFETKYKYSSGVTNSSLVPWVCADLSEKMILSQAGRTYSKNCVYQILGAKRVERIEGQKLSSALITHNSFEPSPTILVNVDKVGTENISKALALQEIFERLDYSCAIISEAFIGNDFILGHYTVPVPFSVGYISSLQSVISDSLILILTETTDAGRNIIDYSVSDWEGKDVSELCKEILNLFSDKT